ncbi:hypothetical protein D3C79_405480 [compost metagenome]
MVGTGGEHPGVFDLGHQTGIFRYRRDDGGGSDGELLGGDLQVFFLGDAVKLLHPRLPQVTRDAPERPTHRSAGQDTVLALEGVTGRPTGDHADTAKHGHPVILANVFYGL